MPMDGILMAYMVVKKNRRIYLKLFSCGAIKETFKLTNTHVRIHTPMNAICENAICFTSLTNQI